MQNAAADMAGSPQGKKFTQLLILYTFLKVWKIEKKILKYDRFWYKNLSIYLMNISLLIYMSINSPNPT